MKNQRDSQLDDQAKKLIWAITGLTLVLVALGVFGWLNKGAAVDASGCAQDGNYNHTIILVDVTDSLTDTHKEWVKKNISEDVVSKLNTGDKLSIYLLSNKTYFAPKPDFTRCKMPDTGNMLYENPTTIAKVFKAKFLNPFWSDFDAALPSDHSETSSPILEMIAQIAATPDFHRQGKLTRLIIVSDMFQNVPELSFYRDIPIYSQFSLMTYASQFKEVNLLGAEVYIFYLMRPGFEKKQSGKTMVSFWEQFIRDRHGNTVMIDKIPYQRALK